MQKQKYSVNQHPIETVLNWVKSGEIAIPEIQRPFVWDSTKVRDLLDSLYQGFPIGYLISWKNPSVRLKDGKTSEGKKVLIDGQQRVTALTAAVLGQLVVNKEYKKQRIQIAFHPLNEKFEVTNSAIEKSSEWLKDIALVLAYDADIYSLVEQYISSNPATDRTLLFRRIEDLRKVTQRPIGIIELEADLDIETVTEIFIRINSKGVVLSQADFAMSKIAANEAYGGHLLRKCIDYFCHLAKAPEFFGQLEEADHEFKTTDYFPKISWLRHENDDLYDPDYSDLLRVAFTSEFGRGRLSDLVSLLSGRNFEKKTFEDEIVQQSFDGLRRGVMNFINETHFKRFVMIIKSAGFIESGLISSRNALNFAYILYLRLRSQAHPDNEIERYVRRWFVMSLLTQAYSGSAESQFDTDIRFVSENGIAEAMRMGEESLLSSAYWNSGLPQQLTSSNINNPAFSVYLAAQCKFNAKGFLSRDITIRELITHRGDIHHLFPSDYLKRDGHSRGTYNQVANYVYTQAEINIRIGNKSPKAYFSGLLEQCDGGPLKYGGIDSLNELSANLRENDIPERISGDEIASYSAFLEERRHLMALKIKRYYQSL